MAERAADDFSFIRERMEKLRKEQEEAMTNIHIPTEQPTGSESNDDYLYCMGFDANNNIIKHTIDSLAHGNKREDELGEYPTGYTMNYQNYDKRYIEEYIWTGLCFRLNRIVYPVSIPDRIIP